MSKITELRTKRAAALKGARDYLEEHRGEDGLVAPEFIENYEKQLDLVKSLGDEIDRLEQQAKIELALNAPTATPVLASPQDTNKKASPFATKEYNEAFWAMMRGYGNTMEVRNALTVGTPSQGGYTVPDEFEHQLIQALEENSVLRQIAKVIRTSSGVRTIPIAVDEGKASWVEEGASITGTDVSFNVATLSAYKLSDHMKVSSELLNDSAFDIAGYIAERFGRRFADAEEEAFINGTGPATPGSGAQSQPTGLLTSLETPDVTTSAAGKVSFDNIYALYYSLKSPYRASASFLCNESLMFKLMTLKDTAGNYIWKPGLDVGKPDTILGRPVYTSSYMPVISGTAADDAGKKVCLFGDFSYYWIADRETRTLKRLDELYAASDEVGFICTQRVDGKLILKDAMKVLALGGNS